MSDKMFEFLDKYFTVIHDANEGKVACLALKQDVDPEDPVVKLFKIVFPTVDAKGFTVYPVHFDIENTETFVRAAVTYLLNVGTAVNGTFTPYVFEPCLADEEEVIK